MRRPPALAFLGFAASLLTHAGCVDSPTGVDSGSAPDAAVIDAGGIDGGQADAALADAGVFDAEPADGAVVDARPADAPSAASDAGWDADVDGVTCVVEEREPGCVAGAPVTYDDVPFTFHPDTSLPSVVTLTSPLAAFETLYNTTFPPMFAAADAAGGSYVVGPGTTPNVMRSGFLLDVDIDVARQGPICSGVPVAPPLIRVRCTGRTVIPSTGCSARPPLLPDAPALNCMVARRDAACAPLAVTTTVPRFWLAPGAHGAEGEIRTDSPVLLEAFGTAGEIVFFREGRCSSYATDVRDPVHVLTREGARVGVNLSRDGAARCTDGLGRSQPVLEVSCEGATTLAAP
jgi:hypothetical protein